MSAFMKAILPSILVCCTFSCSRSKFDLYVRWISVCQRAAPEQVIDKSQGEVLISGGVSVAGRVQAGNFGSNRQLV